MADSANSGLSFPNNWALLLINAPDLCENQKGEIVINQITREIIKNKTQWFGNDNPLLAESAMMDLINEYIKLTKPVV